MLVPEVTMSVLDGEREEMVRCEYLMSTAEVEEITISFSTRKTKVFFFTPSTKKSRKTTE